MSIDANGSVTGAAQNVTRQTAQTIGDVSTWITGNIVEIGIAAGIGTAIALILLGLKAFGARLISGRTGDDLVNWRVVFGRALSKTSFFFIVMCSAELVAEHANTPPALLRVIHTLFVVAAAFQAAIWGRELILGFIQHRAGDSDDHRALGSALGIIRLLVTVALFAIAIVVILDNLGVNVTGLVAGLGIGGIAIGLAAQGIFSDLFAALSILFDRPFRRGDSITFEGTTGTVEQIGLKTTRIRSVGGEEIVIANAKLLDMQIQNWALMVERRVVLHFGVTYQTTPEALGQVPQEVKAIVEAHDLATFDRAQAFQFGDSSIDFELVFHVQHPGYAEFMQTRHDIMLAILRRFAELKVEFAYPTQTTFTAAPDGTMIMPYPHVKMLATEDLAEANQVK